MEIRTTFSIGDKCYKLYSKGAGGGEYRLYLVGIFRVHTIEVRTDGIVYLDDMGYSCRDDELFNSPAVARQTAAIENAKVVEANLQAWEDEDAEDAEDAADEGDDQ